VPVARLDEIERVVNRHGGASRCGQRGAPADPGQPANISENDRSASGKVQVNWRESFDEPARIGYDGWLTQDQPPRAVGARARPRWLAAELVP